MFSSNFLSFKRNEEDRSAFQRFQSSVETFRELELHLRFFNKGFASVLWLMKLTCLVCGIVGGFSAIRLHNKNPILSLLYTLNALNGISVYVTVFQLAYHVTEAVDDFKRAIEIQSIELRQGSGEFKYSVRILKSFPRMGMNVGGFNQVEREAVPIFIDFTVKQVVGLLLL